MAESGSPRTRIRPSGDNRRVLRARWIRLTGLALGLIAAGAAPASAAPLGLEDCGPAAGLYRCDGLVKTWDGIPLDTTVTLPAKSARRLPLVALIHGFGNSK